MESWTPERISTLRRVFGDGDIADAPRSVQLQKFAIRDSRMPTPRVDPRFEALMTTPPAVALHPSSQAVEDAKTWLYAASHQPDDQRKDVLLDKAASVITALIETAQPVS